MHNSLSFDFSMRPFQLSSLLAINYIYVMFLKAESHQSDALQGDLSLCVIL